MSTEYDDDGRRRKIPWSRSELLQAIQSMRVINEHQAREELTLRIREATEGLGDWVPMDLQMAAGDAANLLNADRDFAQKVAAASVTWERIAYDVLIRYGRELAHPEAKEWNPLEDYEKYGLGAMIAPARFPSLDEDDSPLAGVDEPGVPHPAVADAMRQAIQKRNQKRRRA